MRKETHMDLDKGIIGRAMERVTGWLTTRKETSVKANSPHETVRSHSNNGVATPNRKSINHTNVEAAENRYAKEVMTPVIYKNRTSMQIDARKDAEIFNKIQKLDYELQTAKVQLGAGIKPRENEVAISEKQRVISDTLKSLSKSHGSRNPEYTQAFEKARDVPRVGYRNMETIMKEANEFRREHQMIDSRRETLIKHQETMGYSDMARKDAAIWKSVNALSERNGKLLEAGVSMDDSRFKAIDKEIRDKLKTMSPMSLKRPDERPIEYNKALDSSLERKAPVKQNTMSM